MAALCGRTPGTCLRPFLAISAGLTGMPSMPWRGPPESGGPRGVFKKINYQANLGLSHGLLCRGYADCTYESIGIPSMYAPAIDVIFSSVLMPITRTCSQVTVGHVLIHPS